jgi:hypothetical protein
MRVAAHRAIACPPDTVNAAVALFFGSPTAVAVMLAVPAAMPRTTTLEPLGVTLATPVFDDVHTTSLDALPKADTVAFNVAVDPTAICPFAAEIVREPTPTTSTATSACFDASAVDVAVTTAFPAETAVIEALLPFAVTLTTPLFDVDQVTVVAAPFATDTVAASVAV